MHRFLAVVAGAWDSIAGVSLAALAVALVLHVGKLCAEARASTGSSSMPTNPAGSGSGRRWARS